MVRQELVQRAGGGYQDGCGRLQPTTCPPCLLERAGDRTGVADQDGCTQSANVDAQLERIRGDHRSDCSISQTPLDLATLPGQIPRAVATDARLPLVAILRGEW